MNSRSGGREGKLGAAAWRAWPSAIKSQFNVSMILDTQHPGIDKAKRKDKAQANRTFHAVLRPVLLDRTCKRFLTSSFRFMLDRGGSMMTLCLRFDLVGELNVLRKRQTVLVMSRICLYILTPSHFTQSVQIVVLLLGPIRRPIFSYLPG